MNFDMSISFHPVEARDLPLYAYSSSVFFLKKTWPFSIMDIKNLQCCTVEVYLQLLVITFTTTVNNYNWKCFAHLHQILPNTRSIHTPVLVCLPLVGILARIKAFAGWRLYVLKTLEQLPHSPWMLSNTNLFPFNFYESALQTQEGDLCSPWGTLSKIHINMLRN